MSDALFLWLIALGVTALAIRADLMVAYARWCGRVVWGKDFGPNAFMLWWFRIGCGIIAVGFGYGAIAYTLRAIGVWNFST